MRAGEGGGVSAPDPMDAAATRSGDAIHPQLRSGAEAKVGGGGGGGDLM